jgi:hypothetical protein
MVTEKEKWGFTDQINWPKLCTELRESGCAVGLVTVKHGEPLTVVNYASRCFPVDALRNCRKFTNQEYLYHGHDGLDQWVLYRGDHVKAFLGIKPVSVKGYK